VVLLPSALLAFKCLARPLPVGKGLFCAFLYIIREKAEIDCCQQGYADNKAGGDK